MGSDFITAAPLGWLEFTLVEELFAQRSTGMSSCSVHSCANENLFSSRLLRKRFAAVANPCVVEGSMGTRANTERRMMVDEFALVDREIRSGRRSGEENEVSES